MSEESLGQKFMEAIKGTAETVGQGFKEGMDLVFKSAEKVAETGLQGIGEAAERLGPHGASELGAALFNGSAYVMYQHGGLKNQPEVKEPSVEVQNPEITQSKGISM